MAVSEFVQIYSNYDRVFSAWVHQLKYSNRPILTVFATPERAFAQAERYLREKKEQVVDVIPLPIISINRIDNQYDPKRYNNATAYRGTRGIDTTKFYKVQHPVPMVFTYQVDTWTRLLSDLDNILVQIMLRLRSNEFYLDVPMGDSILRTKLALGILTNIRTASEIESQANKQRIMRRVYTFQLYGWLTFPDERYGVVESIEGNLIESDDMITEGDSLGSFVIDDEVIINIE